MRGLREQLADGLLRLRQGAGLSLGQLSRRTGVSRSGLNQIERGESGGVESAEAYARGCGGELVIVAVPAGDTNRYAVLEALATPPAPDVEVLARLCAVRPLLSDREWRLLARTAEVRAEELSEGEQPAPVVALPR